MKRECIECERVLPLNDFLPKPGPSGSKHPRCRICHGIFVRAGNPSHATSADSAMVGVIAHNQYTKKAKS